MGNTKRKNEEEYRRMKAEMDPEEKQRLKDHRKRIREYRRSLQQMLMTTRFTEETWVENVAFRERNSNVGCIYSAACPVSKTIAAEQVMFVLEMNNTLNKIMGIGLVKNHPVAGSKYTVQDYSEYNRYSYLGKDRIDVANMNERELEVITALERACFYGRKHTKRGQGITIFPMESLYKMSKVLDIVDFVRDMFKARKPAAPVESSASFAN